MKRDKKKLGKNKKNLEYKNEKIETEKNRLDEET